MATGKIKNGQQPEVLVNISAENTTGDGTYITDATAYNHHFNQIHVHRIGKMIELNILTTATGPLTAGVFETLCTCAFRPIYDVRATAYGAVTGDYLNVKGVVNIARNTGYIRFAPAAALASGDTNTFRFNVVYMTA